VGRWGATTAWEQSRRRRCWPRSATRVASPTARRWCATRGMTVYASNGKRAPGQLAKQGP
jgi:hypothetical protein